MLLRRTCLLAALFLVPGCSMGVIGGDDVEGLEASLLGAEVHRPFAEGTILDDALRVVDGVAVLEGDIILGPLEELEEVDTRSPQSVGMKSCAAIYNGRCVQYHTYLWPGGRVYYQIQSGFSKVKRDQINAALNHWRNKTPLRFVKATSGARMLFKPSSSSCSADLGYRPDKVSEVHVASWCKRGNLIHEIGHVVGLLHEHVRCNRDDYVKILWDNVESGRDDNFKKKKCFSASGEIFGVNYTYYDYGSIMHYGAYAFSRNGKRTIKKLKSGPAIGQRDKLSVKDIRGVKRRYASELP